MTSTNQLDSDQELILYVYSKYSSERETTYLQYTAALVIFYFLMQKGLFSNYNEQLLVYDYKDARRYLWEDKKFMADINIIRDHDYLTRARLKTSGYRDLNAHYCTQKGIDFIEDGDLKKNEQIKKNILKIDQLLKCKCGKYLQVNLEDEFPVLRCDSHKKRVKSVVGFLHNLSEPIGYKHSYSFL